GKKASQRLWMFKVKEEHDGSKSYKARLVVKGFQQKQGDVHQVGDEREVKNFNWLPSELITEDGVLLEREVIPSLMMLVQDTLYRKSPSPVFG
ncbi:hypothetical protein Tco_1013610, partial [Tanacetum coccineum]